MSAGDYFYWLGTFTGATSIGAIGVFNVFDQHMYGISSYNTSYTVRPVINVYKSALETNNSE